MKTIRMTACLALAIIFCMSIHPVPIQSQQFHTEDPGVRMQAKERFTKESLEKHITFTDTQISSDDASARIEDKTVTIVGSGCYVLSGGVEGGQIIVDSDADVELMLEGVTVTNANRPCIVIKNAKSAKISMRGGTKNVLTWTAIGAGTKALKSGAVSSDTDLAFGGEGKLYIDTKNTNAVVCAGSIDIQDAKIWITSSKKGIVADKRIRIRSGIVSTETDEDAFTAGAVSDKTGAFYLQNGFVTIRTGGCGIVASNSCSIKNGGLNIIRSKAGIQSPVIEFEDRNYVSASVYGGRREDGRGMQMERIERDSANF